MHWNATAIKGFLILGSDGSLGTATDLLFEDRLWAIRWLAVDTGHWLSGRKVLLPASVLDKPNPSLRELSVHLTKRQIEQSPDIDAHRPVSRQIEIDLHRLYALDPYWTGGIHPLSNAMALPFAMPLAPDERDFNDAPVITRDAQAADDPHLRSVHALSGYRIHASDGQIGHIQDVVFDDGDWTIRHLEVDTRNWWPGRHVLIEPKLVTHIDAEARSVLLSVTRETVRESPPYDPATTVNGAYAEKIHAYYAGF